MAQSKADMQEDMDLQSVLKRAFQSQDMQKLLNHPQFPSGDTEIAGAMNTIATKLARSDLMGAREQAAAKAAGIGTIAHPEFDTSGGNSSDTSAAPLNQLSEGAQRAVGALELMRKQEEAARNKKAADLKSKTPSGIDLLWEILHGRSK